jgi:hypothetical protein
MLYCSTARQGPFFECQPSEGDTLTLVSWRTTAPILVNHVGYTKDAFAALESNRMHASWGPGPIPHFPLEGVPEIAAFLAEQFTRRVAKGNEHYYKVTVAVAEHLFQAAIFDGLLYPTIVMQANCDNFAIKPAYVEVNLQFRRAEFVRIDRVKEFAFDITVLDTATKLDPDGTICWKGRLDQWVLRNQGDTLIFTAENGNWVARDPSGRTVEPE